VALFGGSSGKKLTGSRQPSATTMNVAGNEDGSGATTESPVGQVATTEEETPALNIVDNDAPQETQQQEEPPNVSTPTESPSPSTGLTFSNAVEGSRPAVVASQPPKLPDNKPAPSPKGQIAEESQPESREASQDQPMIEPSEESNFVSIKVRTLAGKAALFEIEKDMTLLDFRQAIFDNFQNIPLDEQRLLYKGKMIEILDPATRLDEIGFKDNDLVHLVRVVGQKNSPGSQPLRPPPNSGLDNRSSNSNGSMTSTLDAARNTNNESPALQMLTVLVPPGPAPGDRLRILPQGRGAMLVTVPAGVFAGDRFRVLLPPEDPNDMHRAEALLQAEQQRQQVLVRKEVARQSLSRPQIMAVIVPKGFKAGQVMDVNVPGKGRVRVTIPNGVKAGQQFKFRLPN